jgi:drug/metabolite transporter (DMT)-like permease
MEWIKGLAAMAVTIVVWAGFALTVRGIGGSGLTTMDAALIRFTVPVLLLAPWIPRTLRRLRAERPAVVAGLCVGAGLPYFLVASFGGSLTSAALVGLVIPGTVPIFVALLAYRIRGSRIGRRQAVALAVILAGVALAGQRPAGAGTLVLLLAGLIWAVYTLSLRVTVLDPIGTVLVLCLPSASVTAALVLTGSVPSNLAGGSAPPAATLLYLAVQGVGVGVLAALCYPIAIRRLGSRAAASLGALSPVVTAVAAAPLLGEPFTGAGAFALVVGGVIAFNLLTGGTAQHAPDPRPAHRRPALAADGGLRP